MLKKLIMRYGNMIASLSLIVAVRFVFHSCRFLLHQPEEPEELKRLAEDIQSRRKSYFYS